MLWLQAEDCMNTAWLLVQWVLFAGHDVMASLASGGAASTAEASIESGGNSHVLPAAVMPQQELEGALRRLAVGIEGQKANMHRAAHSSSSQQPLSHPDHAALLQLSQLAADSARLLQQYWRLPTQLAAQRLELGRAAAARSCAYLRCTNLEARGGPAAGQGAGSLRCSACRMVWYCGTACSHADWRAGHKLVCKALAAERQRQRGQGQGA